MPNYNEAQFSFPQWIDGLTNKDVGNVKEPLLVISKIGTRTTLDDFIHTLSLPLPNPTTTHNVRIDCHEKSMGPVVSVLPNDYPIPIIVTLSAKHIERISTIDEHIPIRIHLGQPKKEEVQYEFVTTPDLISFSKLIEKYPDSALRIHELLFDGNYPGSTAKNWNLDDFIIYAKGIYKLIKRFGEPKVSVRIHPDLFGATGDIGWTPRFGLNPKHLLNLASQIGLHDYINFTFYISPLTTERVDNIQKFLASYQNLHKMEVSPSIAIDGFPGYGVDIPLNMSNVIKYWHSHKRQVSLGLGTYLAERSSVLMFPSGTTPDKVLKYLPDAKGLKSNLRCGKKSFGLCVMHPISYAEFFIPGLQHKIIQ